MPVFKYLDLSTSHVTEEESVAIDQAFPALDDIGPRMIRHDYGWWVNVQPEFLEDHPDFGEHYPNVAACINHAIDEGCNWINFDQDAATHEGLPVHDW